jgi:hypothetical protein
MIRRPPCSRASAQGSGLLDEAPHGADAAGGDAEPLLGEPGALEIVPAAQPADHGVLAHLHVGEADRGVAVRVGVGEGRVVDDLDAVQAGVDEEQRGEPLAVHERGRHDDVDRRDVAVGDEPLLAVQDPAAAAADRGCGDARGVGARLGLGDRVGVVELAADRGLQVALDLLRGTARKHVVGARNVPRERVRRAPQLLLDEEPLELCPTLAAVLGRVQAAGQPRVDRRALDPLFQVVGDPSAASLGELLVRDQHLVDEAAGACLQIQLLGRQSGRGGRRGGGADRHARPPGSPSFRLSWFSMTSSTRSRAGRGGAARASSAASVR